MDDIDAAEEWLSSWAAQADQQAERSVELARRVADLTGSARSRDPSIRVTVRSSGQVDRLDLDNRVRSLAGAELALQIMTVIRRAEADLSAKVADEVRETVGIDSETGRAVVHSFETRFPSQPETDRNGEHDDR